MFLLVRDIERRTRYFLERLQEAGYDGYAELRVLLEVMHYARANLSKYPRFTGLREVLGRYVEDLRG